MSDRIPRAITNVEHCPPTASRPNRGQTILLVEDEELIRKLQELQRMTVGEDEVEEEEATPEAESESEPEPEIVE